MLRRLHKQEVEVSAGKLERKKSKRQRIVQWLSRSRKQKAGSHDENPPKHAQVDEKSTPASSEQMHSLEVTAHEKPEPVNLHKTSPAQRAEQGPLPVVSESATPLAASEVAEVKEAEEVKALSEVQIHTLFSGAPHFSVTEEHGRPSPAASYPWNSDGNFKDSTDCVRPQQPAFLAASLRNYSPQAPQAPSKDQKHCGGYDTDTVEVPDMLCAHGVEPGSVGFTHYLELPISDSLITDVETSQSSKDFLQGTKNKELLQSAPERIGIRAVDMSLVYDRLVEFQDMYEAFHDSPGPMSILNNQSAGDLYANMFSKFLTPPGFDGTSDDPTGLRVQIVTLMRILNLKGIWCDFSLVEWRIRLGQILWSDPEPVPEHEAHPLWTEREVLLLQITLACELLLRLDAVTIAKTNQMDNDLQLSEQEIGAFLGSKTRKLDWDLVLARRFLENILVVKSEPDAAATSKGFLAMLAANKEPSNPKPDVVLLPQHQARQIAGLVQFAETTRWPNAQTLIQELVRKLGLRDGSSQIEQLPSPDQLFLDPITPASISVYGTPLQTPRSTNHVLDGYFGHIGKPVLTRDTSQSLRIPLSPTLSPIADRSGSALSSVGGWLSRSYLTGLVLPGEALSHFLVSTLLENDQTAIACLGDSANLYGGFSYTDRTWWSKNSIVARVFACVDGATECMGWISVPTLPEGLGDRWHSIHSEQLPFDDRLSDATRSSAVAHDSATIPNDALATVKSADLTLPRDLDSAPIHTFTLAQWELTPLNPDLMDSEALSAPPTESDINVPSLTFISNDKTSSHILTLAYDVQFISSWPCHPPASPPAPSMPQVLRRSLTGTMSRSSSKRSALSRRNSHGFEPLMSHPPDSADILPKPIYVLDTEGDSDTTNVKRHLMAVHPLHISYTYKLVPVDAILDPNFVVPFDMHAHTPRALSPTSSAIETGAEDKPSYDKKTVLILDARGASDMQHLARAWCAEKGYHAIIGRVGRTCLACCVREARGVGVNVVIRV
ncbi:hypothetical protein FB567DRAFT_520029 [Paraphoma chrysanthemicola]|uniref:Uncharacterized protein n=1 Tax=Paraphoma chrysanthemicola TaxID=798071 RepID=A0A8K0RDQ3_9PLEO|nr:hypothetical protein FB567DRAFT_520029 [Paraphoma chrysanthemicola]